MKNCEICGEPMPAGEEMFKFHGYSSNCPKPPLPNHILDDLTWIPDASASNTPTPDKAVSERVRPDVECAPWVIDEIKKLEAMLDQGAKLIVRLLKAKPSNIPDGWKLLKDTTQDERSWPEDENFENGGYMCRCSHCLRDFIGHKRRTLCRACTNPVVEEGFQKYAIEVKP